MGTFKTRNGLDATVLGKIFTLSVKTENGIVPLLTIGFAADKNDIPMVTEKTKEYLEYYFKQTDDRGGNFPNGEKWIPALTFNPSVWHDNGLEILEHIFQETGAIGLLLAIDNVYQPPHFNIEIINLIMD